MGQDIPFRPSLYVLGDPAPLKGIPESHTKWIHTAIMLGRKLLIREWKSGDLPSFSPWFIYLGTVAAYEELSYRMIKRLHTYHAKWGKYIDFIKGP